MITLIYIPKAMRIYLLSREEGRGWQWGASDLLRSIEI